MLRDFLADIFDYGARRAGSRQIAADDFDHTSDSGQRVADFVRQPGRQFTQSRECSARDIWVRCRRSISSRLSRSCAPSG